jgi:hypothetical protein
VRSLRHKRACTLVSLNLSLNPLGADGTTALAEHLSRCETVEKLTLRYVTLYTRDPANLLGSLLSSESALKSLDLSFNYITACGSPVELITAQLGANQTLTDLRVRRCCIGGWRRARALARGLMTNCTLTSIDLSYNGLGAAQAAQSSSAALSLAVGTLCQAFARNRWLRSVDLSHNALGMTSRMRAHAQPPRAHACLSAAPILASVPACPRGAACPQRLSSSDAGSREHAPNFPREGRVLRQAACRRSASACFAPLLRRDRRRDRRPARNFPPSSDVRRLWPPNANEHLLSLGSPSPFAADLRCVAPVVLSVESSLRLALSPHSTSLRLVARFLADLLAQVMRALWRLCTLCSRAAL